MLVDAKTVKDINENDKNESTEKMMTVMFMI